MARASRPWCASSPATFRRPTAKLLIGGEPAHFSKPAEARAKGVEVVYQDLALCNNLSAAANVFLGREIKRGFGPFRWLDHVAMAQARRRIVHGAEVGDAAARPRAADVGRPAPGGRDRAHAAVEGAAWC